MNPSPCDANRPSRLWLWFVGVFVVQALVWAAWITIAHHNPVEEVPLVQATSPR
jgi:hypothetical protein